jgi:hypothetical protein
VSITANYSTLPVAGTNWNTDCFTWSDVNQRPICTVHNNNSGVTSSQLRTLLIQCGFNEDYLVAV